MLKKRIIPKITFSSIEFGLANRLAAVTTRKFKKKRVIGNPVSLARIYEKSGADQLLIINKDRLNISNNPLILELIKNVANEIAMPVCFGGGISSLDDCAKLFYSGIDKISINLAAVNNPKLITEITKTFGSQALTICIDYWAENNTGDMKYPNTYETASKNIILNWVKKCQDLGAGEINLSCVSKDGSKTGLDYEFAAEVRTCLEVPLLISGGCDSWEHFAKAFKEIDVDGVIASTFFVETDQNMVELKNKLIVNSVPIRGIFS